MAAPVSLSGSSSFETPLPTSEAGVENKANVELFRRGIEGASQETQDTTDSTMYQFTPITLTDRELARLQASRMYQETQDCVWKCNFVFWGMAFFGLGLTLGFRYFNPCK